MTVPMVMRDLRQSLLQLPSFRERNFEIAPALTHAVWLESKTPLESSAPLVPEQAGARTHALRGELADTTLGQSNAVITARRNGAPSAVWSSDSKAGDNGIVLQRHGEQPAWMPQRAVLVIDASVSMRQAKDQVAEALGQFPPNVELGLVMAGDEAQEWPGAGRLDPVSAGEHIRRFSFEGGRDNLAALTKAWDWAGARQNGAIVWIHGPQPVLLGTAAPLLQRYERRPHQVRLYQLEAVAGPNRLAEKLDGLPGIAAVPHVGSIRDDLAGLFAQWQPGAKQIAVVRERLLPGEAGMNLSASAKTSDHIARLWAADQVGRLTEERGTAQRDAAIALAQRYQLVTPVSGAVVLETRQQYTDAGLEPVPAGSVPTVPEPETWMLILLVLSLLTWQLRRTRAVR
jgi:hypothetical protein